MAAFCDRMHAVGNVAAGNVAFCDDFDRFTVKAVFRFFDAGQDLTDLKDVGSEELVCPFLFTASL